MTKLRLGICFCLAFSIISVDAGRSVAISGDKDGSGGGIRKRVFREYIGAMGSGVRLDDVAVMNYSNSSEVEFHFILAFAIDYTSDGSSATDGRFSVFWDAENLSPQAVAAMKQKHQNVRVMVSLGGDSVNGQPCQFNPLSVSSWLSNAVSSLFSIITDYQLDGIDIDYEHFDYTTPHVFASAIGSLISTLKHNHLITSASIAPFDDVHPFYSALWASHSHVIDLVNFQFYTYPASTSVSQFLNYYKKASQDYSPGKVLASFSTDLSPGVSPSTVLSASKQLVSGNNINNGDDEDLAGIFVWCADTTLNSSSDLHFRFEIQAQHLLAFS